MTALRGSCGPPTKVTLPAHLNHLIELLSNGGRERLLAGCTAIDLSFGDVLCRRGDKTAYLYFPTDSFVSLITQNDGEPALEVALIGAEGLVGASLALGVDRAPLHALVQGPGTAWRISTGAFRRQLLGSARLRRVVHTYLYVFMAELATSSSCARFHEIGPRLARWLLMTQDRARTETLHVTQEFLAHMLGVRRVGITVAACALQERGVIAYWRGELRIVDRKGLEDSACSCYARDRDSYSDILGVWPKPHFRRV